jgi:hypothetical protein
VPTLLAGMPEASFPFFSFIPQASTDPDNVAEKI